MNTIISAIILIFSLGLSAFAQTEQTPCPTLEVSGGGVVRSGESMNFAVNITGLSETTNLKYEWEISNGTISSGPGTPTITVDTTGLSYRTTITATVKVVGLPENCSKTASETGAITPLCILPRTFDEFRRLSNNDVLARIQNLYVELGNDSGALGYIINYGTEREFAARQRQIQSATGRLKLDASRVKIIYGGANPRGKGAWTRIYITPKDVDISPLIDF